MRLGVAVFVGLLAFAPAAVALVVQWPLVTPVTVATWAIPLILWLGAWPLFRLRTPLMIGAVALLLAAMVFISVPDGFTWPRLSGVALALAVTTATLTGVAPTLLTSIYAVVLLGIDYSRAEPQAGHLSSTLLDAAGITALGLIVLATAIAVVAQTWDQVCRDADGASEASRTLHMQSLMAERSAAARAAVDRRIHETVLNTLAAVARGTTSGDAARQQCRADLEALDSIGGTTPRGVGDMVALLIARADVPGPVIPVVSSDVRFRDDEAAAVASAALSEVLRNVSRHARARTTKVRVRSLGMHVIITVADNGVGMDESRRQRFGMRRALSESVEAIGGSVTVTSAPGVGTEVSLTIPLSAPSLMPPRAASAFDVLLSPPRVRAAMLSIVAMGLLFIIPVSLTFTLPWLLVTAYAVLFATVTILAVRWDHPSVATLSWLALALVLASQVIAWQTQQGCSSAAGMHLMVFSAAGALVLPVLAQRSLVQAGVMLAVAIASSLFIASTLPTPCRAEALIPAIEESLWLVALVGIIAVLARAVDRAATRVALRWEEIAQATARRTATRVMQQRWNSVDASTRGLLSSLADGTALPRDPLVRDQATHLEARLRSLLETSKITSEERRGSIDHVIEQVTASGVSLSVLVLDSGSSSELPDDAAARILAIADYCAGGAMHLTLLDDEVLVSADPRALIAAGCTNLDETEDPRMAIACLRWSVDVAG